MIWGVATHEKALRNHLNVVMPLFADLKGDFAVLASLGTPAA